MIYELEVEVDNVYLCSEGQTYWGRKISGEGEKKNVEEGTCPFLPYWDVISVLAC